LISPTIVDITFSINTTAIRKIFNTFSKKIIYFILFIMPLYIEIFQLVLYYQLCKGTNCNAPNREERARRQEEEEERIRMERSKRRRLNNPIWDNIR
jgi:hypothetical protein